MSMRVARLGSTDPIKYRMMLDYKEAVITGAPAASIYSPGGGEVTGLVPTVSVNGSLISVSVPWLASTFTVASGYMLHLEIVANGETHKRKVLFAIAPRTFESEVCDQDIFDENPNIESEAPPANNGGLEAWRRSAWEELSGEVAAQLADTPAWRILDPSPFRRAHIYAVCWQFYAQNARDTGPESEDWEKAEYYEKQYRRVLTSAFSRLTVDEDANDLASEDEINEPWTVRWTT
jgi:hypothetical protein